MHTIHLMPGISQQHDGGNGRDRSSQTDQGVVGSNHLRQVCDVDAGGNLVAHEPTSGQAADDLCVGAGVGVEATQGGDNSSGDTDQAQGVSGACAALLAEAGDGSNAQGAADEVGC